MLITTDQGKEVQLGEGAGTRRWRQDDDAGLSSKLGASKTLRRQHANLTGKEGPDLSTLSAQPGILPRTEPEASAGSLRPSVFESSHYNEFSRQQRLCYLKCSCSGAYQASNHDETPAGLGWKTICPSILFLH